MSRFIFCLLLICFTIPSVCASRSYVTRTPYYRPYSTPYLYGRNYNPDYADMNALEKYAFNKNYFGENHLYTSIRDNIVAERHLRYTPAFRHAHAFFEMIYDILQKLVIL